NEIEDSVLKTVYGYTDVLKDGLFIAFCMINLIISLVYMQLTSTLPVFLRDTHDFPEQYFGYILSLNALMVVLFQFWIANKVSKYDPMKTMAFGMLWFMIGFGMYGFVSEVYMFFAAMGIITIGEMINSPVSQASVAIFAPDDKRGRYMAMHGFTRAIPSMFGVILAGLVIEFIGPNWVWYFCAILCLIASIGYYLLRKVAKERFNNQKNTE
ncbi:MAG: MFS transporter, partial [Promethearchaeota archaeon]